MITPEEVEPLRPEEKDAVLDAILGMAWSDGSIALEEVDVIRQIASLLTDSDIDALVKDYKPDNDRVSRKIAKSDLGPAGKKVLLRAMAYVAAAEGSLDEKELAFYRGCLRAFGVNDVVRQKLEAEVRRNVYSYMLKRRLRSGEYDERAKEEMAAMRKRLEIDDAAGAEIEKLVRKFVGKT